MEREIKKLTIHYADGTTAEVVPAKPMLPCFPDEHGICKICGRDTSEDRSIDFDTEDLSKTIEETLKYP